MNEFKERLSDLMSSQNLSRLQVAKSIGVTSTTINGYFNNNYYPDIKIALRLGKFFECSLDFLFGLSDSRQAKHKNNNSFIDNLDNLLAQNKVSIAKAFKDMKMSEYNYYRWKNGLFPRTINLIEIAKYFDCSIDYLIGDINK